MDRHRPDAHSSSYREHRGPVGILAGSGNLPIEIRRALRAKGRDVHVVALEGSAERGTELTDGPHDWVGIAQIKRMIGAFRANDCTEIMIAGGVRRPDILRVRPDVGFFTHLPEILQLMRGGDDRLLRKVVRFFENQGFRVRGLGELAPELLAPVGALASLSPDVAMGEAAMAGGRAISALARFDVGQAVIVRAGGLAAIEGAEGTDGLMQRFAEARVLVPPPVGAPVVLVKLPKPGQDLRVDLPVIGPETIENAARAGISGIAIEAGGTVVIERDRLISAADAAGIVVWGITKDAGQVRDPTDEGIASGGAIEATVVNRRHISRVSQLDAALGYEVLRVARRFGPVTGAVVSREHVLSIGIGEPAVGLIERSGRLRQWGDGKRRTRRHGAIVISDDATLDLRVVRSAAGAGLAAVFMPEGLDGRSHDELAALAGEADRAGITIMKGR
jgi:UDP-2,3-diacylglucosamine hydrolase